MKLYNTLTRTIEEVVPIRPPHLSMYACGVTVYDYVHIGHVRKYFMDDLLIKTLRHAGFSVTHVQNITDVGHLVSDADDGEDKMEKGAKKYGKTVWDVAQEFEAFFWKSLDIMRIAHPDVSCRATQHIPEQIALVKKLEEKGYTYNIENDGVYFDTAKFPEYGKMAHLDIENLKAGARIQMVEGKKNPTDFALWKFSPKGAQRQMEWDAPWGKGFPGWHIECSAMSMKYLGEQIDIHTGGIDHIPVHHTNEIAQSEAATGKVPFVKYWVHHNFLRVEGQKMSKSLNNFYTIDDIVKKGYSPMALKLLFLGAHYRSELNFTWNALDSAQKSWENLLSLYMSAANDDGRTQLSEEKLQKIDAYRQQFYTHIENDIKTPEALAVVWEVLKSNIPGPDKVDLLTDFDSILSLYFAENAKDLQKRKAVRESDPIPEDIQKLFEERTRLRETKKYQEADNKRKQIEEKGWMIVDIPGEPSRVVRALA